MLIYHYYIFGPEGFKSKPSKLINFPLLENESYQSIDHSISGTMIDYVSKKCPGTLGKLFFLPKKGTEAFNLLNDKQQRKFMEAHTVIFKSQTKFSENSIRQYLKKKKLKLLSGNYIM